MKKALRLIALAGLLTTSWLLTELPSYALPSCGLYQGKPCTGTSRPRCQLAPGEPAVCFCVNGTYDCS